MDATDLYLCRSVKASRVLHHHAYGDRPRYFGEDGEVSTDENPIIVYIRCERESGHSGKHLNSKGNSWDIEDTSANVNGR